MPMSTTRVFTVIAVIDPAHVHDVAVNAETISAVLNNPELSSGQHVRFSVRRAQPKAPTRVSTR